MPLWRPQRPTIHHSSPRLSSTWTKRHLSTTTALAVCSAGLAAVAGTHASLSVLGFKPEGVRPDSPAAGYQSRRKNIEAGSMFSTAQSAAARGSAVGVVYGVPAVVAMGVTFFMRRRGRFISPGGWGSSMFRKK